MLSESEKFSLNRQKLKAAYTALLLFMPWNDERDLMSQALDQMQHLFNNNIETPGSQ